MLLDIEATIQARIYRPRLASSKVDDVLMLGFGCEADVELVKLEEFGDVELLLMPLGIVGPKSRLPQLGQTLNLSVSSAPHD
jgi:hypothetical protein